MHQLKALIWKAYKVRLRSPFTTALDLAGPIVTIIIYLVLKVLMGALSGPTEGGSPLNIFSKPTSDILDPSRDISQYLCNKVLFFSPDQSGQSMRQAISQRCGIELINMSSGVELIEKLRSNLILRIDYHRNEDLNRPNTTEPRCYSLNGTSEPSYQAGIILNQGHAQVYMTESADNPVIHQPYTQGSTFNEYHFPQSDINSGYHLFEICIANALGNNLRIAKARRQTNNLDNATTTNSPTTTDKPTTTNHPTTINNSSEPNTNINPSTDLKWQIKAFPETLAPQLTIFVFMVFQLAANLCNATATVIRAADDNESGLHHYIRSSGVSASIYWAAQMILIIFHMIIQSLIIAILLSIPTSSVLCDPIFEANITMRWLLIFSYSIAINAHAIFVGSLFTHTSHALLVTCLLAVAYSMYPLFFMVQWSPYGFSPHSYLAIFVTISNPVSNYQALLIVIYSVYVQTNEPLSLNQLPLGIIGGGLSDWTLGSLWLALITQTTLWLLLTIIIDKWRYSSDRNPLTFPVAMLHELICCNRCEPKIDEDDDHKLDQKTKSLKTASVPGAKSAKSAKSQVKDPNRICCSLRNFTTYGPSVLMAYTKRDALKMSKEEMAMLQHLKRETVSKTDQFLIERSPPKIMKDQLAGTNLNEIYLNEAIQQNIIWQNSNVMLENLNLDFRYNQVSFILGQTDQKELFFAALMGMRTLSSGYIILDGTKFSSSNISAARRYIGQLSERDIFIHEMTIFENLQFFGSLRDESYTQYDSESSFVLSLLHLTGRQNNLPMVLTSRSARKLSMAVAAVGHTKLLLLVEPTLSLPWRPRCHVLNLLQKYKSIRSIIVDTSDVDEATAFGDRVVLLKDGKAFLDGPPAKLAKRLSCGYWLFFDSSKASGSKLGSPKDTKSPEANADLSTLEKLTSDLFEEDKLQRLELIKRPVYRGLLRSDGSQLLLDNNKQQVRTSSYEGAQSRTSVVLKVRQTHNSDQAVCRLIKLFAQNNQQAGFKLSEVTYESIEDILVLMMSKAVYPDLPPDLLLSLSHRTHSSIKRPQDVEAPLAQVSVRRMSSDLKLPKTGKSIFSENLRMVVKDRASSLKELSIILISIIVSIACVAMALCALQVSLAPLMNSTVAPALYRSGVGNLQTRTGEDESTAIERLYGQRIGLYIVEHVNNNNESVTSDAIAEGYRQKWPGNFAITGIVHPKHGDGQSDTSLIADLVHKSRDLLVSLILYNPITSEVTVLFEPQLANAMISGIKVFNSYYLILLNKINNYSSKSILTNSIEPSNMRLMNTSVNTQFRITRRHFRQTWHEMVHGHLIRRLFYGIGFALAEGIAIGVLVLAPIRHRSESRVVTVRISYWLAMALFDLAISAVLVTGYLIIFVWIESIYSASLLLTSLVVFLLYKVASLPIAYLVSLVADSGINGFFFILLIYITTGWVFAIHLKTFIDWTLINEGYQYAIASWFVMSTPISSLVNAQANLNHLSRMNALCPQVPVYTATTNIAKLDGPQRRNIVDDLLIKVRECLANGKNGISTNVINHDKLGVMWNIYLIVVFAIIAWMFLLFSERFFGIISRRFFSARTSNNPLKTIVRTNEPSDSLYKWNRERDRLVSEYIKCVNEAKYVKKMNLNCLYLRIWLRPLLNQSSIEKRIKLILEPLIALGQPSNEIHVELKTTLQIFIRIGTVASQHKVDRIQLIQSYSKFMKQHSDIVAKFAIVDWTREMLYKILLHGRYNTESTAPAAAS